jgi:hypothetical protein
MNLVNCKSYKKNFIAEIAEAIIRAGANFATISIEWQTAFF